jgi:Pectate lyase superfamily protein
MLRRFMTIADDPKAVYLTRAAFPVTGDGVADDSDAIRPAIDKVQSTSNQGLVFVAEGRHCITKTLYLWFGIRIWRRSDPAGLGPQRPRSRVRTAYSEVRAAMNSVEPSLPPKTSCSGRSGASIVSISLPAGL